MEHASINEFKPPSVCQRLRGRLFPTRHCPLPQPELVAPFGHGDVIEIQTVAVLGWTDRLRVLLTGRLMIRTRTITEHRVGALMTSSTAYPSLLSRRVERHPEPM